MLLYHKCNKDMVQLDINQALKKIKLQRQQLVLFRWQLAPKSTIAFRKASYKNTCFLRKMTVGIFSKMSLAKIGILSKNEPLAATQYPNSTWHCVVVQKFEMHVAPRIFSIDVVVILLWYGGSLVVF